MGINIESTAALLGIYLKDGETEAAHRLLEQTKQDFEKAGAGNQWRLFFAQTLTNEGNPGKALALADTVNDATVSSQIRMVALGALSTQSGEWQPLVDHLERSYKETKNADFLLELCRLKFQLQDWSYLAEHGNSTMEAIQTAEVARLVIYAAWNAQRVEQCLDALTRYESLFPGGSLPSDLWRLRVQCHWAGRSVAKAVEDAERLLQAEPSPENTLMLMEAQLRKGDLKSVAVTARRLLQTTSVTPDILIRGARLVYLEQLDLAKNFWRQAKNSVLDHPDILGEAISMGYTLGLDAELPPFLLRMQEYAKEGRGSFRAFDTKQLVSWITERSKHLADIQEQYGAGQVPLHGVASLVRSPLAEFLHGIPLQNRQAIDLRRQPIIFARSGGRPIAEEVVKQSSGWRLHADVTALLLGEHLGILEKVEKCFAPIRLSSALPTALHREVDDLSPHQPSILVGYKSIVQLLDAGKIQSVESPTDADPALTELSPALGERTTRILTMAHKEQSFAVAHLPLVSLRLDDEAIILPEEFRESVVNCRSVVDCLRNTGRISSLTYDQVLRDLGSAGQTADCPVPPIGARLFLIDNIGRLFASAGILDVVANHFHVFVDCQVVEGAKDAIRETDRKAGIQEWLERLRDRVRDGLETGLYQEIALPTIEKGTGIDDLSGDDPDLMTVADLLRYEPLKGDVLWIDDRFINSHGVRDNDIPIIGINEILKVLYLRGELNEQEYYAKLIKLREGNFRYIPIEASEIVYHLNQAAPSAECIGETPELSVLRRYIAACLLDSKNLQRPPLPQGSPNPLGEIEFIIKTARAVTDSVARVWFDESSSADLAASRCDWIIHNLHTGTFGLRHLLPNSQGAGDGVELLGVDLFSLLADAISLPSDYEVSQPSRRAQFFEWFAGRVLLSRFRADPAAVTTAAQILAKFINDVASQTYDQPDLDTAKRLVMQRFLMDLPEALVGAMQLPPNIMEALRITVVTSLGSLKFQANKYDKAVERAVNGEKVTLRAFQPKAKFRFRGVKEAGNLVAVEISTPDGKVVNRISDPILKLYLRDPAKREQTLRDHRFWFDSTESDKERMTKEILSLENAKARFERALSLRQDSQEFLYRTLEEELKTSQRIYWPKLVASCRGIVQHFRVDLALSRERGFLAALQKSVHSLLLEEGLEVALSRLACLPIRLPDFLVQKFRDSDTHERQRLIEAFHRRWTSPIAQLHLVSLVAHSCPNQDTARSFAQSVLDTLFDETRKDNLTLFAQTLRLVNKDFTVLQEATEWPADVRLAMVWAHACRLQSIFHSIGAPLEELLNLIERRNQQQFGADILVRDLASWNDVVHPLRFNRLSFLTHGVASILSGLSPEVLEGLNVWPLIEGAMSGVGENNILELLSDPTLAINQLESFLGGDRAEALRAVGGGDNGKSLSSQNLHANVRQAVEDLSIDSGERGWAIIAAIVGTLPIYDDLRVAFRDVLEKLDIGLLLRRTPEIGPLALHVGASQSLYYSDNVLRPHLETGLLELTRNYNERPDRKTSSDSKYQNFVVTDGMISMLIDAALMLSFRQGDARATTKAWGDLLLKMLDRWPAIGSFIAGNLATLLQQLPARYVHGLWPVMLGLRASSRDSL